MRAKLKSLASKENKKIKETLMVTFLADLKTESWNRSCKVTSYRYLQDTKLLYACVGGAGGNS